MAILVLSSALAFAQNTPGMNNAGGINPTVPNGFTNSIPQPSNDATTGFAAGRNPGNSQDLSNRSNPQDLTRGASNPQSLLGR
jgi:hypothetical protein